MKMINNKSIHLQLNICMNYLSILQKHLWTWLLKRQIALHLWLKTTYSDLYLYPTVATNTNFWVSMCSTYPIIFTYVIQRLISFATTWLGESGLVIPMSVLKTNYRNMICDCVQVRRHRNFKIVFRQSVCAFFPLVIETRSWRHSYCRLFASHNITFDE